MQERKKINEVIPNWLIGSGIFSALNGYAVPWQYENIAGNLDLEYHGNISGDKFVSPLVNKVLGTDTTLSDTDLTTIAGVIYTLYGKNWEEQWYLLNLEYNPIENYSMIEKMTNDVTTVEHGLTNTRTDNTTHTKTGTDTETRNLTDRNTPNVTTTGANSVYGFNSDNAVPTATNTATENGTTTDTHTGNDTLAYNTSDRDTGTVTHRNSGTDTHTHNYTLTRAGNIGTLTSTKMLQDELTLRRWYFFFETVFPDIDKVLTLPIY